MSEQNMTLDELRAARARWVRPSAPGADLHSADLRDADLRGANLRGAYLYNADLRGADLRGARVGGGCILSVDGLPSHQVTLVPTADGWHLGVGCQDGIGVEWLREIALSDDPGDWPEADDEDEIAFRRPLLLALITLCEAHMAAHADVIVALAERWGK